MIEAEHHASTGYLVIRAAWGKGYASEIARAMADLAFTLPSVRRLSAFTHADHAASGNVNVYLIGTFVGYVGAVAVDAAVLAHERVPREAVPAGGVQWQPTFALTGRGATGGGGGVF
jgi:hypothetical protein